MTLRQVSIKSNMVLRWGGVEVCQYRGRTNIPIDYAIFSNVPHRLLHRCCKGLLDGGNGIGLPPSVTRLQRLQRQLQCFFVSHGRFLSVNKHGCISQHDSHIIGLTGLEHGCGFQLRLIRGGCSHGDNAVFVEGLVGSHWVSLWYDSIIPGSR